MAAVRIILTRLEAIALQAASSNGAGDDAIDYLGFTPAAKAAYRRADRKLSRAIRGATE